MSYLNIANIAFIAISTFVKHGSHRKKEFSYMLHRKTMQLLSSILDSISLSDLQLPARIRKKGHRKGCDFCVIGLPYKKRTNKIHKKIPPFK